MIELSGESRKAAIPLFRPVPVWWAFLESAVERGIGSIVADDDRSPGVAVLFYGGLVVYAGDPESPSAGEAVRHFDVQPMILGYDPGWTALLENTYGGRLARRTRWVLQSDSLSVSVLEEIASSSRPHVEAVRAEDVPLLEDRLGWHHPAHHYAGSDDFVANGNAFVVRRGGDIVSGASSFAVSSTSSECQVTTAEAARRQGLALEVSSVHLTACLEKGLSVPWDASNENSVRLAQRLGYRRLEEYSVFELGE